MLEDNEQRALRQEGFRTKATLCSTGVTGRALRGDQLIKSRAHCCRTASSGAAIGPGRPCLPTPMLGRLQQRAWASLASSQERLAGFPFFVVSPDCLTESAPHGSRRLQVTQVWRKHRVTVRPL